MALYRVRLQRTMLQQAWVEIEASGRRKAAEIAVEQGKADPTIPWKEIAVNSLPTSEQEVRVK